MEVTKTIVLSGIILLGVIKISVGYKVIQEAYIYASETRDGIRIDFSEQPDWSDLNTVLQKHGFLDIGSVCVYGPWILYRLAQYDSTGPQDYSIVSGADNCVQPGHIQSMQPIGTAEGPFSGSVTFFTQKYFSTQGFPITSRRGKRFFDSLHGPVRSMIVVGRSQWTVYNTAGKSFCLATNFDPREKLPICLVPDLSLTLLTSSKLTNIHKGCSSSVTLKNLITLEDCHYFGERRPDLNEQNAYRPRVLSKNLKTTDGSDENNNGTDGNFTNSCPNGKPNKKLEEFITLLSIRLNHDFGNPNQLLWPEVKEDVWKTEILDQTYDIAMAVIPLDIVPLEYLQIIREFMIYHLSLVWKHQGINGTAPLPERFLRVVQYDLMQCFTHAKESAHTYIKANQEAWMTLEPKIMFAQFKREGTPKPLDIVIDTTWVIANLVMGVCHHLFDYTNNFWANFIHTFNTMYLYPLIEDWKTLRVEDQFLLGGYDYDSQYQRIAIFATIALEQVPNLEPFERPVDVTGEMKA